MNFLDNDPNLSTAWRSIVLFGVNVASYKFALARELIDSADRSYDLVQMDELALPYATHLCAHLRNADKQNTQSTSRFLAACRRYNANGISKAQLIDETKKYGFQEVLKAFHRVNGSDIEHRFFLDERRAVFAARGYPATTADMRAVAHG